MKNCKTLQKILKNYKTLQKKYYRYMCKKYNPKVCGLYFFFN